MIIHVLLSGRHRGRDSAYLAVIDCGGVGYACKTTNTTLAQLKRASGELYTYLDVGENAFGLYGFATANELNSFKLLIGVSGVGPKAALAILSAATPGPWPWPSSPGTRRA